jgi:hypothetical protein
LGVPARCVLFYGKMKSLAVGLFALSFVHASQKDAAAIPHANFGIR